MDHVFCLQIFQIGKEMTKMLKKRIPALLSLAAGIVLMTACGKPAEQAQTKAPAETSAAVETSAAAPAASNGMQAEDGLLRVAILYDMVSMDVTKTTDNYMVPLNVFDRLFETRSDGGSAKVEGSLCTEYSVSEDGLVYTFTLRDGVVFSNGSALTASDVKYSFERLLIAANENTEIPLEVAGGEELMNKNADSLEGFEVLDDTHFTVRLKEPNAGFVAELSSPAMSIVDAETMKEVKNFGSEPADTIGTGPYRVTEWVANDHYTLEYNDKYWGPEPTAKKVDVRVIPDPSTQNLMFQNGELDMIDLQSLDSSIVESSYKPVYPDRIVSAPRVGLNYFSLNENNEYLQDVNVRKAVAMAIDVDEIIEGIYSSNAIRQNGIIPTGIWGHNDELQGVDFDPEGAKKLLKESGYQEGEVHFELAVDSAADSNIKLTCQAVSQMLEAAGIRAEIKNYDHSAFLDLRLSGKMDSFIARWGMDYNDPANIMYTFFGSPEKTAQRSLNYKDTDVMARVAAAPSITDDAEREKEYQALEKKIVAEDAAWVPILEEQHLYCLGSRMESFTPHWAGFSDFYAADAVLK